MISPESADKIKNAADIVEVVSDFVSLKKRGVNYIGLCPFHSEKTPSFNVNPSRGIFKCFGCGKGGDSVTFVMEVEKISYPDALRYLAKKYQIELEEEKQSPEVFKQKEERESLFIVSDFAKEHFKNNLYETPEGKSVGLSYFKERGFHLPTLKKFELGYARDVWDDLLKAARNKGFKDEFLERCGLLVRKDNDKVYDRFRGRVIFPIHNATGRVVAFGARTLKKDEKPKYLNSPETEIYHKSEHLYGIFQAKDALRKNDECFLVEGYTDVISMHEAGIENVVASSGTSLTEGQIKLIKRYTHNVTVLFDGDAAGIKAALRGIDLLLEQDLNVHVCILPDGEDPDSFAKKFGSEKFANFVRENAKDFISFKTQIVLGDAGNDPIKRAQAIGEIVESIVIIPDAIKRSTFYKICSQNFGISEEILIAEGNKILAKKVKHKFRENEKPKKSDENSPSASVSGFYLPEGNYADYDIPPDALGGHFSDLIPEVLPNNSPKEALIVQDSINFLHVQEEEIVRLLVCYGAESMTEEMTVAAYILSELEDVHFEHPIHAEIVIWYKALYETGILPRAQDLLAHESKEVREVLAGLFAERYELSENWKKMFDIDTLHEKDLLDDILYVNILRFKHLFLKKMIDEKHRALLKSENEEETMRTLREYQDLKSFEMQVAALLGVVVSGKF
jgi:DNA primase